MKEAKPARTGHRHVPALTRRPRSAANMNHDIITLKDLVGAVLCGEKGLFGVEW